MSNLTNNSINPSPSPEPTDFLFYNTEDGKTRVRLLVDGHTCWMTQLQIAELFDTSKQNVSLHIQNIYDDSELPEEATVKDYLTVQTEGERQVSRPLKHYNLEMILAIGYRVRSPRGTQFRRWATETLHEFLVKGFVLDDERLKSAEVTFGKDYFDELLERIRDIRASERRFYQKLTDIYATSSDYDSHLPETQTFFSTVQNKLEWAITGKTAAELIQDRANAERTNMGLTTWKNTPDGAIRKGDVTVAKNYLSQDEISELNRIVTMYLDYAEDQASRQQATTMNQWTDKLDSFLQFNDRDVLSHSGSIKKSVADKFAKQHYETFVIRRRTLSDKTNSDFDTFVEKTTKQNQSTD